MKYNNNIIIIYKKTKDGDEMKIVDVDHETKKSKFKRHILPIIKTGLGLGVTCYFLKTGVLHYENLINMDKVYEFLPSNIPVIKYFPILPQEIDFAVKLAEESIKTVVNTVGLDKMLIAAKALPFIQDITKPILESDKIKNSPVVHKIKEIFKAKENANELEINEESEKETVTEEVNNQSNINSEDENKPEKKKIPKIPEKVEKLIIGAASLGLSVYLISTHQVDFNNLYNFDNLPHKFARIKEIAKGLNMNNIHLGVGVLNMANFILKKDTKTIETPPMMAAAPINYRKILDAVDDFTKPPIFRVSTQEDMKRSLNKQPSFKLNTDEKIKRHYITLSQLKATENEIQSPKRLHHIKDNTVIDKSNGLVLE